MNCCGIEHRLRRCNSIAAWPLPLTSDTAARQAWGASIIPTMARRRAKRMQAVCHALGSELVGARCNPAGAIPHAGPAVPQQKPYQDRPMTLSMYQASAPVFTRMLTNLGAILTKAEEDAATRKIDPAIFLAGRLAPDMLPLTRQIQIASDAAKGCIARLADMEVPGFPDTETDFAGLQARIAKTLAFIQTAPQDKIDGTEARAIVLKFPGRELNFSGQDFLFHFALPNFFFHVTTAYAILRHAGVPVGKMDYLGGQ
jgi:hypothetical protein